jgi:NAD(P)-dependent dehydrogenase (short-subunit alcohol dehydrogenase family)
MVSYTRVAVVTGAGSGIGRAVALALHANGFQVVLAGRREAELKKTAELAKTPGMDALPTDITDARAVRDLFQHVQRSYGNLDVLFNNAGTGAPPKPFEDLSLEEWARVLDINLTGAFLCAQAAFILMKTQSPQGGRIINNGSISASAPRPNSAPYTATKHGITGLTKSLSLDGRKYNIACGQIDIGNAATEMTEKMAAGVLQANGELVPEPRLNVEHVAEAVVYMANLPLEANVQFMTLMATQMPFIGRG